MCTRCQMNDFECGNEPILTNGGFAHCIANEEDRRNKVSEMPENANSRVSARNKRTTQVHKPLFAVVAAVVVITLLISDNQTIAVIQFEFPSVVSVVVVPVKVAEVEVVQFVAIVAI